MKAACVTHCHGFQQGSCHELSPASAVAPRRPKQENRPEQENSETAEARKTTMRQPPTPQKTLPKEKTERHIKAQMQSRTAKTRNRVFWRLKIVFFH